MIKGDAASKAAARDAEFASVQHDRSHLMVALSHLSALGFVDDAYRMAEQTPPSAEQDQVQVLFEPLAEAMRRDPRFVPLTARLGLAAYWRSAGKAPDFCASGDLPYSCKGEIVKTAAQ